MNQNIMMQGEYINLYQQSYTHNMSNKYCNMSTIIVDTYGYLW